MVIPSRSSIFLLIFDPLFFFFFFFFFCVAKEKGLFTNIGSKFVLSLGRKKGKLFLRIGCVIAGDC